ncbi:hypothetical protein Tco_0309102 [Tanacetum coccineum]
MKRLADLKAAKEKSEKFLKKILNPATIRAQTQKMAEHEAKSYVVNLNKEATTKITRGDNPMNLIVHPNFRLKTLGFSEWLEGHALSSKKSRKSNDMLLMTAEDKKRKRTDILKEVFVTENITVDGMHRNLLPSPGIEGRQGLVIREPGADGLNTGNEWFMSMTAACIGSSAANAVLLLLCWDVWSRLRFVIAAFLRYFHLGISVLLKSVQIIEASTDFEIEGRIAWVEVEGKSINEEFKIIHRGKIYWIRANETPGWVPDFTDDIDEDDVNSMDIEDVAQKPGDIDENSDGEGVPDTIFEDEDLVKSFVEGNQPDKYMDKSEDPFNLYSLLNRKDPLEKNVNISDSTLKYPPGFTPSVRNSDEVRPENKEEVNDAYSECCENNNSKGNGNESISSGHFKVSEIPRTGGSMIGLLEEVVKVGQVMGYKMEGCISNMEEIIGSQGVEEAIQETKMEKMDDFCVKQCWGNLAFDHIHSEAVGNSGGILCVWDPNSFCKSNVTLSDYFVINRGLWRLTGKKMMVIAVYAPQECKEKKISLGILTSGDRQVEWGCDNHRRFQ